MLIASIRFLSFFDWQPLFGNSRLLVYRTLVVRRKGHIIDSARGANGIGGWRERTR